MRGYAYLPTSERECIRDMIGVRNNWAHVSAELPGKDTIVSDIECLIRFFTQMNRSGLIPDLEQFKARVERPEAFKDETPPQPVLRPTFTVPKQADAIVEPEVVQENDITERSLVYIVGSPDTKGMVFSVTQLGDTKKLQARSDLENIMIICPKPLVADRKWENEMKRFDEEFTPLDGDTLRQIISDTDRDGEWPTRYGKVIVPYSILDARTYQGNQSKRHKSFGLQQLDPAPHFDLVIIDEAHHLRNGSMEKDKAFAYKCVHYFCQHADAVVMLTATPLQTSDDDLYTLLNLLRPDVVIDKKSFTMMSRPNPYISQCAHIVRAAKENWKAEALETLDSVLTTQWGENVIANNPSSAQIYGQ